MIAAAAAAVAVSVDAVLEAWLLEEDEPMAAGGDLQV